MKNKAFPSFTNMTESTIHNPEAYIDGRSCYSFIMSGVNQPCDSVDLPRMVD